MKTFKKMKFAGVLCFFLGLLAFNQTYAQTTTWQFDGGDGKGGVKIIEKSDGISAVYLLLTDGTWGKATINTIDDYEDTYMRITFNSAVSEIYVYWYDDKLVQVWANGKEKAYWLKK
jgi:hypothetical protein